jgi:hypothetical protein
MTITVQNTALTSTFDFWRTRTNELAHAMTYNTVTVGGDPAVGDAEITGSLTVGSIVTATLSIDTSIATGSPTIRSVVNSTAIGLVNTVANVFLTIPTAYQISNGQYFLNANSQWSVVPLVSAISNNGITTTGTIAQLVDAYDTGLYGAAEYLINTVDNTANGRAVTRILTYHDIGSGYSTEYSTMFSNATSGQLATFVANVDANYIRLWALPTRTSMTIKYARVIV